MKHLEARPFYVCNAVFEKINWRTPTNVTVSLVFVKFPVSCWVISRWNVWNVLLCPQDPEIPQGSVDIYWLKEHIIILFSRNGNNFMILFSFDLILKQSNSFQIQKQWGGNKNIRHGSYILYMTVIIIYWILVSVERGGFQCSIFIPVYVCILLLFGQPHFSLLIPTSILLLGSFQSVNNSSCLYVIHISWTSVDSPFRLFPPFW